MLRESSIVYGYDLDVSAIVNPEVAIGVPGGNTLLRFVDAALDGSSAQLSSLGNEIAAELGPEALVDAAAVFGNFEMMNRIAEGTGIALTRQFHAREKDLVHDLGLDDLVKH